MDENLITASPEEGKQMLEKIESTYVATLPLRSIGVCQWTRSDDFLLKDKHYKIAVKRAQILRKLLAYPDDKINMSKANEVFKNITYPANFEFKVKENGERIEVQDTKSDKSFHILKSPEGVLAAKTFSLLIALKNVYTLCLEEPDRGMHPQYAERILNWLVAESKDKTLLIVTHNPYMINTIVAENAFVFFRQPTHYLDKTPYGFVSIQDINRQITDVDEMKKVIFASNILFVEGKTDKIIIEGIYDWYMKRTTNLKNVSRQIVVLGGKQNTTVPRNFCKQILINYAWLFDRDKYIHLDKRTKKINEITFSSASPDYSGYIDKSIDDLLSNETCMSQLFQDAKKERAFFWKNGELEDAIRCSLTENAFCDMFSKKPRDIKNKEMKDKIKSIDRENLDKLIGSLLADIGKEDDTSKNEFFRFHKFLQEMEEAPIDNTNSQTHSTEDMDHTELKTFMGEWLKLPDGNAELSGIVKVLDAMQSLDDAQYIELEQYNGRKTINILKNFIKVNFSVMCLLLLTRGMWELLSKAYMS